MPISTGVVSWTMTLSSATQPEQPMARPPTLTMVFPRVTTRVNDSTSLAVAGVHRDAPAALAAGAGSLLDQVVLDQQAIDPPVHDQRH